MSALPPHHTARPVIRTADDIAALVNQGPTGRDMRISSSCSRSAVCFSMPMI